MSRFRATKPKLPKATLDTLRMAQDLQTIRMLLSNGATVTPIGPVTYLSLDGQARAQQFPTALVDYVRQRIVGMEREP
jgi:hypothetical protein